jgi:hypothetical protein
MLSTSPGRCSFFNPYERNFRKQELVNHNHGQTTINDRLNAPSIVWHGVDDKTINRSSPEDILVAFATLQEQQPEMSFAAAFGYPAQEC